MTSTGYLLDNRRTEAGERFAVMARMFNPATFRRIDAVGITTGWRCWEVGAGGASVPRWLAERVGPEGEVLATDIDLTWLDPDRGYRILRHDVTTEPPPDSGYDLVHARAVLMHLPAREQALASMISALRPGGWLVLEDVDPQLQPNSCPDEQTTAERRANRLRRGFRTLLERRGADTAYARTIPRLLRAAGMLEVGADVYLPFSTPDCALLEAATVRHIRDDLVAAGLASSDEIDDHLRYIATDPGQFATSAMVTAWARKPLES